MESSSSSIVDAKCNVLGQEIDFYYDVKSKTCIHISRDAKDVNNKNDVVEMTPSIFKQLCLDILQYLDSIESKESKDTACLLYISGAGELDLSHYESYTNFEVSSNYLKIGVTSKNKIVGYSLLFMLKMIIDLHFDRLCSVITCYLFNKNIKTIGLGTLVRLIGEHEQDYTIVYSLNEKKISRDVTSVINSGSVNTKTETVISMPSIVDIWTLQRITNYVSDKPFTLADIVGYVM